MTDNSNTTQSDQNAGDPSPEELQQLIEVVQSAGLDPHDNNDFRLFMVALEDTQGDFEQALRLAQTRKPASKSLDMYFAQFRNTIEQENPLPRPVQKDPTTASATEVLDDYFAEFRKRVNAQE